MSLYTRIVLPHYPEPHDEFLRARAALEAKIEELVSMLDLLDDDCDLEADNDGEPSLGAPEQIGSAHWYTPVSDDRADCELEDENDEDGADQESLLGKPEHIDQTAGGYGLGYQGEECDLGWNLAGHCGELVSANDGREHDDSEIEPNGDEEDSSRSEDDNSYGGTFKFGSLVGGSGL